MNPTCIVKQRCSDDQDEGLERAVCEPSALLALALRTPPGSVPVFVPVDVTDLLPQCKRGDGEHGLYASISSSSFFVFWGPQPAHASATHHIVQLCPGEEHDAVARVYDSLSGVTESEAHLALWLDGKGSPPHLHDAVDALHTVIVPACLRYIATLQEPEECPLFTAPPDFAAFYPKPPAGEALRMLQKKIQISGSRVDDAFLLQFKDVQQLQLRDVECDITDEGVRHLWGSLTTIVMSHCTGRITLPGTWEYFKAHPHQLMKLQLDSYAGVPSVLHKKDAGGVVSLFTE